MRFGAMGFSFIYRVLEELDGRSVHEPYMATPSTARRLHVAAQMSGKIDDWITASGPIFPSECLPDAEEKAARGFARAAVELKAVVQPQEEPWRPDAHSKAGSAAQIAHAEVGCVTIDVPGIHEAH